MTAFHGFGTLVLIASETLLILDITAIPFSAFDVKLGEVAVTGDPYHLWVEFHHSNFIRRFSFSNSKGQKRGMGKFQFVRGIMQNCLKLESTCTISFLSARFAVVGVARLLALVNAAFGPRPEAARFALPAVAPGVEVVGRVLDLVAVPRAGVVATCKAPA